MRKTQARVAERARRRSREERKQNLTKIIPLTVIGITVLVAIAYFAFTAIYKPPRPANAGIIGPKLQVDQEKLDLGKRALDVPVRAEFKLTNAGDDTLNLAVPPMVTALEGC